jgi:hypothetical protein
MVKAMVLNSVIAASGSKLLNDKAGYIAYRTDKADTLINAGAFMSVSDLLKQMGGDVYVKRALASTILQAGGDAATLGQFGSFEISVLTGRKRSVLPHDEPGMRTGAKLRPGCKIRYGAALKPADQLHFSSGANDRDGARDGRLFIAVRNG